MGSKRERALIQPNLESAFGYTRGMCKTAPQKNIILQITILNYKMKKIRGESIWLIWEFN